MTTQDLSDRRAASGVQVIERAVAILRTLKNQETGLSLGQIAERVGLPRSTVQRLVDALKAERLVIAATPDGGIRLGPEIQSLAESGRLDVVDFCRPHLIALSRQTGETVDLAVLKGDRLVFIDQVIGEQRLRAVSFVGDTFPLTTTANGKATLALFPDRKIADVLRREKTERSPSDFLREMADIRANGIAFDLEEHSAGIKAVGSAFRDRGGTIYAVSIPVPAMRFDAQRDLLARELSIIVNSLAKNLG
ncbi:MAG: IclR family transcriptional regulator [Ancalomicrobiaceae bacterium]|nr:IclR family transcriptional regulator [Ancalomicrobiaceae bacterium]